MIDSSLVNDETQDVINALFESGRTLEEATQIAMEYCGRIDADDLSEAAEKKFEVDSLETATWLLKKFATLTKQLQDHHSVMSSEMSALEDRFVKITKPINDSIAFFHAVYGPQLQAFAAEQLKGSKSKSYKTLYGDCSFRKNPDALVLDAEEDEIIRHLRSFGMNQCLNTTIKKSEIKKIIADLPEGMAHIEPGAESFTVKAMLPEVK